MSRSTASTAPRTAPRRKTIRRARFDVRTTEENKQLLQQAAALRNVNLSDFILDSAQREAEHVLAAHHIITLSSRDSRAFAEALAHPPTPTEHDIENARDYLSLYHPHDR